MYKGQIEMGIYIYGKRERDIVTDGRKKAAERLEGGKGTVLMLH